MNEDSVVKLEMLQEKSYVPLVSSIIKSPAAISDRESIKIMQTTQSVS